MPRKITEPRRASLSCTNCRARKRKCDGKSPCQLCVSKHVDCTYVHDDKRRSRPRLEYVEALESANQCYQQLLEKLRNIAHDHRGLVELLTSGTESLESNGDKQTSRSLTKIPESVKVESDPSDPQEVPDSSKEFDHLLVSERSGVAPVVLGPTSVYHDGMIRENKTKKDSTISPSPPSKPNNLTPEQIKDMEDFRIKYGYQSYKLFYFKESVKSEFPLFRECISLFFKWMYSSSFLFIHRESFLYFFLNNEIDCEFVSMELIYAISALGARISTKEYIRSQADGFYQTAKNKTLQGKDNDSLSNSSISKSQTLLCLALYDLGRGDLTSCWLLSGLAFRMGLDIGFDLDPKEWNVSFLTSPVPHSSSAKSLYQLSQEYYERERLFNNYPFDIRQVRSRIFWGSYVVDRFICLAMGRSTTLRAADATIPNTQDIGDLTGIEDFIFFDHKSDRQYTCRAFHCLKAVVALHALSDDILKKVFESSLTPGVTRLKVLSEFNVKLMDWKQNLDPELFWNKSVLEKTAHNELCMGPRYTFFIIVLSVNRPFVSMAALGKSKAVNIEIIRLPIEICDDIIEDLEIVIKALKVHEKTYNVFCPHILSVYATILAISVLLWRFKMTKHMSQKNQIAKRLQLFVEFLEQCGEIWSLACKPAVIVRRKINELWLDNDDIEPEVASTTPKNPEQTDALTDDNFMTNVDDNYTDIEGIFQTIFGEPMNQSMLTRPHLADALWDEAFYDGNLDTF